MLVQGAAAAKLPAVRDFPLFYPPLWVAGRPTPSRIERAPQQAAGHRPPYGIFPF